MVRMPLTRRMTVLRLPAIMLGLLAVAVVAGGPAAAQDLSPINTFFTTLGTALTGAATPPLGAARAAAIEQAVDALAAGALAPLADLLTAPVAANAAHAA